MLGFNLTKESQKHILKYNINIIIKHFFFTNTADNLMEVFINKNGSPSNRSFVSYRTTSKDNLNLVGNLHQFNGNNSFMQNPMLIKEFSYSTRRKQGLRR